VSSSDQLKTQMVIIGARQDSTSIQTNSYMSGQNIPTGGS